MVSSIAYKVAKNDLVTGFGVHRKHTTSCGRGYVRKVVGAVSRPALTYIANKISGTGGRKRRAVRKPRTVHSAGSWKPSGMGVKRRPRASLTRKLRTTTTGTGAHKTRRPRSTLRHVRGIAL